MAMRTSLGDVRFNICYASVDTLGVATSKLPEFSRFISEVLAYLEDLVL